MIFILRPILFKMPPRVIFVKRLVLMLIFFILVVSAQGETILREINVGTDRIIPGIDDENKTMNFLFFGGSGAVEIISDHLVVFTASDDYPEGLSNITINRTRLDVTGFERDGKDGIVIRSDNFIDVFDGLSGERIVRNATGEMFDVNILPVV